MGSENKNGKVPLISKIAYGFGDVGCNFSWMFVSNFLMIFYTDVFGISMAAVSALMLFQDSGMQSMIQSSGDLQIKQIEMGTVPSMVVSSGTNHSDSSCYDILGKTRLAAEWKDYLYGNYILSAGFGVYLCEYSIWNLVWCYDTGY